MKENICKTCKKISVVGIDILGVHICSDCLNSISNMDVTDTNYEYYKGEIGSAWREYEMLKSN